MENFRLDVIVNMTSIPDMLRSKMNCRSCGMQILPQQRFCRSCGESLGMITQPLVAHASQTEFEGRPATVVMDGDERARRLMLWGFIIMFIGVTAGVIGKKLMYDDLVTVVGALVSIGGMFLIAYPYLSPFMGRRVHPSPILQANSLGQSHPIQYLPPERSVEYVPSITERTTGLLENSAVSPAKQTEQLEPQALRELSADPE